MTAFKLSELRNRRRLQEAIGADHPLDTRGCDPGRYFPSDAACRASEFGVFFPSEGPGDARARMAREKEKCGALLDTSPRWFAPPVVRKAHSDKKTAEHDGFGFREKTRFRALRGGQLGPGSYDIPSCFDAKRPALGRALAVPLTRGLDGATWMPARNLVEPK